MKCSKCGNVLKDTDVTCPVCGHETMHQDDSDYPKYEMPIVSISKTRKERRAGAKEAAVSSLDYEEIPEKKNGFKRFAIVSLIIVLILCAGAFAMYYAYNYFMKDSNSEYVESISKIKTSIDDANREMAGVLKTDGTLPTSDILSKLAPACNALNKISSDLDKTTVPTDYSTSQSKLVEAVKLNRTIYQQLESIIKNPVDPNAQKKIQEFTDNLDQCMNDYLAVDIKNISFKLPDEVQNLPPRVNSWSKQKQSEYAQVSSLIATFTKYFDAMSKVLVNYDNARVDITPALKTARSDRNSWVNALSMIDDNENAVKLIKDSYLSIQVPKQLASFNKEFAPVIDDTLAYYVALRQAIQTDMQFNKDGLTTEQINNKTKEIETMYQNAEKLNSTSAMNYQKFTSSYSVTKDKFMNPDYVMTLKYK